MQNIAKLLVYAVLVCLLLPWAGGKARLPHFSRAGNQMKREKALAAARLRRCRNGLPDHRPVRFGTAAIIPPDDDDDDGDRERLAEKDAHKCSLPTLHTEQASRTLSLFFHPRPPGNDVSLHQTLCLLLI
jgi:hypothetical protein